MRDNVHVALSEIVKYYADQSTPAVNNVSVDVHDGELMTLLGPSGSGKTTLLNIIAGFLSPDSGRLSIGGRNVTELPAHRREIGMVFQNYALFPHMSVAKNIEFPLRQRKVGKIQRAKTIGSMLEMVQLEGKANARPNELSGGQKQRVALARALAFDPDLLLMDEPLGALDKSLRGELQQEIRRLHKKVGKTLVFVTHDQEEALALSDRIAVVNHGAIEQIDTARMVYEKPVSLFSARFLGESTIISGQQRNGRPLLDTKIGTFRLESHLPVKEGEISLVLRPEHVRLVLRGNSDEDPQKINEDEDFAAVTITDVAYQGGARKIYVDAGNDVRGVVLEISGQYSDARVGDSAFLLWDINATWLV